MELIVPVTKRIAPHVLPTSPTGASAEHDLVQLNTKRKTCRECSLKCSGTDVRPGSTLMGCRQCDLPLHRECFTHHVLRHERWCARARACVCVRHERWCARACVCVRSKRRDVSHGAQTEIVPSSVSGLSPLLSHLLSYQGALFCVLACFKMLFVICDMLFDDIKYFSLPISF